MQRLKLSESSFTMLDMVPLSAYEVQCRYSNLKIGKKFVQVAPAALRACVHALIHPACLPPPRAGERGQL